MADFVAVLRKTIDGIADPTPELRQRVYAKARATIEQKLAALNAPEAAATRQRQALEDAIAEVESEFTPAVEDVAPAVEAKTLSPPPPPASTPPHFKFTPIVEPEPEPEVKAPEPLPAPPKPPKPAPPSLTPGFTRIGSQPDALEDFLTSHGAGIDKRANTHDEDTPEEDAFANSATTFAADGNTSREPEEDDELKVASEDRETGDYGVYTRGPLKAPARKKSLVPLLAILGLLLVIAGGGYAGWVYKDRIAEQAAVAKTWLANLTSNKPEQPAPAETANNAPAKPAEPAAPTPAPAPAANAPAAAPESTEPKPEPKLTQRLMPDGQEVNPGPANDKPSLGEGTSVAASTPDQAAQPGSPQGQQQAAGQTQPPAALPIGQKAFFYEERSGQEAGTADAGGVVWSVVQESPGNDLPPEPAIKAEVTIPDRGINLRMIIRRNGDKTLPASHLVEMIFTVPQGFPGGSIENVSRMTFKDTEQAPGSPLVAIPAKIADNFFIIAMNDAKTAVDTNMALMGRQSWIDIPIAYKTGRRALLTLEKGLPGEKVFNDVLKSWAEKAGG